MKFEVSPGKLPSSYKVKQPLPAQSYTAAHVGASQQLGVGEAFALVAKYKIVFVVVDFLYHHSPNNPTVA